MDNFGNWFEPRQKPNWGLHPKTRQAWLASLIYLLLAITPSIIASITSDLTWVVIAVIWILLWSLAAIIFARWYLKKYYPDFHW